MTANGQTNTTSPLLKQPHLNALSHGAVVEGIYRVCRVGTLSGKGWQQRFLRLRDATHTIKCLPGAGIFLTDAMRDRAVRVRFTASLHPRHGMQARLNSVEIVEEVPHELVLALLPRPRTQRAQVRRLVALADSLPHDMRKMLVNVLQDDSITRPLLVNPASWSFHHSERGGLLRHSLEAAEGVARRLENQSDQERGVAVIAAFFHDIGKTQTLGRRGHKTDLGRMTAHEALALAIVRPALRGAPKHVECLLSHILTAAYPGQYGVQPKTPLVDLVRWADRESVRRDRRSRGAKHH